jgi:hypothetical protein
MFRQRLAALAVLAALPFTVLACSSNSSKGGALKPPPNTSQPSSPPATGGSDSTGDPTDTGDPTGADTPSDTGSVGGGSGDSKGDAAAFCKLVAHPDYLMGEYGPDKGNPDGIAARLHTIDDAAPADIKDDVHLVADTMASAAKGDTTAMQSAGQPEFQTAQHKYMAWNAAHCG